MDIGVMLILFSSGLQDSGCNERNSNELLICTTCAHEGTGTWLPIMQGRVINV